MAFSKLLMNTQNNSRLLKTRPAVCPGNNVPRNKVISPQSSSHLPQVISAAAAEASNTPRPGVWKVTYIGWKDGPGGAACGHCLLLLVYLITDSQILPLPAFPSW